MFSVKEIARLTGGNLLHAEPIEPTRAIHDSRLVRPGDMFIALPGRQSDGHAFLSDAFARGASGAIVSNQAKLPNDGRNLIVVNDPLTALHQWAAAWRNQLSATFIAITGSNGKTTVKRLLTQFLSSRSCVYASPGNYNTEIGVPLSLLSMPADACVGVFELGAEAPGDILSLARLLRPSVGIVTTVSAAHLEGFETIDAVAREKWALIDELPDNGLAIVNADSPHLRRRADSSAVRTVTVGLEEADVCASVIQTTPQLRLSIPQQNIEITCPLLGSHNATNVLLAAAAALELGASWTEIAAQANRLEPAEHRLQPIAASFGTVIDDSYNANPASTTAALNALADCGPSNAFRIFVFGSMAGLGSDTARFHRDILSTALALPVDVIVPVGTAAAEACQSSDSPRIASLSLPELRSLAESHASRAVILIKGSRVLELEEWVHTLVAPDA